MFPLAFTEHISSVSEYVIQLGCIQFVPVMFPKMYKFPNLQTNESQLLSAEQDDNGCSNACPKKLQQDFQNFYRLEPYGD